MEAIQWSLFDEVPMEILCGILDWLTINDVFKVIKALEIDISELYWRGRYKGVFAQLLKEIESMRYSINQLLPNVYESVRICDKFNTRYILELPQFLCFAKLKAESNKEMKDLTKECRVCKYYEYVINDNIRFAREINSTYSYSYSHSNGKRVFSHIYMGLLQNI